MKLKKGIHFLMCATEVYCKYAWIVLLKDKKCITIDFQKFLNESGYKPNKIWVDKGSEFYNRSIK